MPSARRLYPVGRLDAETTGLILLTDDGELAHRLTHPSFEVPRTYRAKVRHPPVREDALKRLREGIELEDGTTAPARVKRLAPDRLEITIHEGRKRQVRRMCDAVGHPVVTLERIRFGPLWLGRLEEGQHRRLTAPEVEKLQARRPLRDAAPMRLIALRGATTVEANDADAHPLRNGGADARAPRAEPARQQTRSSAASSRSRRTSMPSSRPSPRGTWASAACRCCARARSPCRARCRA